MQIDLQTDYILVSWVASPQIVASFALADTQNKSFIATISGAWQTDKPRSIKDTDIQRWAMFETSKIYREKYKIKTKIYWVNYFKEYNETGNTGIKKAFCDSLSDDVKCCAYAVPCVAEKIPFTDKTDILCIIGLMWLPTKQVKQLKREIAAQIGGYLKRNERGALADLASTFENLDYFDDIHRNDTSAGSTPPAQDVGGIEDTTSPDGGETLLELYRQTAQALIIETVKPLLKYIDNKDEKNIQKHFKTPENSNFSSNKKQCKQIDKENGFCFFDEDGNQYGCTSAGCWVNHKGKKNYILINHKDFYDELNGILEKLPRYKP